MCGPQRYQVKQHHAGFKLQRQARRFRPCKVCRAPECVTTGKASKESDVYSFGVVMLEICCGGRRTVERNVELSKVNLVEWVWNLYGEGHVLEAADMN